MDGHELRQSTGHLKQTNVCQCGTCANSARHVQKKTTTMKTTHTLNSLHLLVTAIFSFTCVMATAQELAISRNTNHVTLTWSTNYPDFILESTGSLTSSWTNVADATNGAATLPMVSSNQFFRLKETVSVTYVANEGFLISGRGKKVLVDGIFYNGYGYYQIPTAEVLDQETNALPPFDNLNALLVSHKHGDHVDGRYTFQHMTNDPTAVLVTSSPVINTLRSAAGSRFLLITNRIIEVGPTNGTSTNVLVGDMSFKVVGLPHDDQPETYNEGYLFNLGGLKFFHTGDFASTNLVDYQVLDLASEQIDVLFLGWFIFLTPERAQEVIAYLNPKSIFVMHVEAALSTEYYQGLINALTNLPPVYLMNTQMTTIRLPAK